MKHYELPAAAEVLSTLTGDEVTPEMILAVTRIVGEEAPSKFKYMWVHRWYPDRLLFTTMALAEYMSHDDLKARKAYEMPFGMQYEWTGGDDLNRDDKTFLHARYLFWLRHITDEYEDGVWPPRVSLPDSHPVI